MASISTDNSGKRRIQFVGPDGSRKSIRLGKVSLRKCEEWVRHIEQILEANRFNQAIEHGTVSWTESLTDELYQKLAAVGLVASRETQIRTLRAFLDGFIQERKDVKPATKIVWKQVADSLSGYFGDDRKMISISEGDAEAFKQHLIGAGFASTTVHKRLQFSRMLFKQAIKRRILGRNPFAEVSSQAIIASDQKCFIERSVIDKLMPFCNTTWKTIIALARYGGLRTPSETLSLRWEDIDWEKGRVCVQSPKTEHHPDGATRMMPLFPELRKYLLEAKAEAAVDEVYVVDAKYRIPAMTPNGWANSNLRTQLLRLLTRAGLKSWPRLFHNLRATRETELVSKYPIHVVSHWLGNTPEIAMKHYLLVTEADFAKGACLEDDQKNDSQGGAKSGADEAQNEAQHPSAPDCIDSQKTAQVVIEKGDMQEGAISCDALHTPLMEAGGIEPPSRDTSDPASTCLANCCCLAQRVRRRPRCVAPASSIF